MILGYRKLGPKLKVIRCNMHQMKLEARGNYCRNVCVSWQGVFDHVICGVGYSSARISFLLRVPPVVGRSDGYFMKKRLLL